MIDVKWISAPSQRREIIKDFNPRTHSWVVSDLKSKLDLQSILLEKHSFLEADSVIRASELWRKLLNRVRPDFRIISAEFACLLIKKKLLESPFDWAKTPGAPAAAFRYLSYLMPVLSHPEGIEGIKNWFKTHSESYDRWGHWFLETYRLWNYFLSEKLMVSTWAGGVLVNEPQVEKVWTRPLIVDLSVHLMSWEAELFEILSRQTDVMVVRPFPSWAKEYEKNFSAYALVMEAEAGMKVKTDHEISGHQVVELAGKKRLSYQKFTTMMAEVKQATSTVRQWLDNGIPLNEIAITAPDIGVYWPSLSTFLREEGVPVQRGISSPVQTFPEIAKWLSQLRVSVGLVTSGDLEISLFHESRRKIISFERFRVLFSVVYGEEDLKRSMAVESFFRPDLQKRGQAITRDEFVGWILSFWEDFESIDRLEKLIKTFVQECPDKHELSLSDWLDHLGSLAAKIDIPVEPAFRDGINCFDLASAENSLARFIVVLGVTEESLRQRNSVAISPRDISSLHQELGFTLPVLDNSNLEFEARWILQDLEKNFVLLTSASNFDGDVQAPAMLWVTGAQAEGVHAEKTRLPERTRMDEIQRADYASWADIRHWDKTWASALDLHIQHDLGQQTLPAFGQTEINRLSPSALEDYLECPFIFAAKRVFRLSDLPNLDLDLDHMTRGKLMHAVFEKLLNPPIRFDRNSDELDLIIESARQETSVELVDELLWPALKKRYRALAERFLTFEKQWRGEFVKTRTVAIELEVKGFINPHTGDLNPQAQTTDCIPFAGYIDRVDSDGEGHYIVIDYKTSKTPNITNYGAWLENNSLQLALYSMALQRGLTSLGPCDVSGAVYFIAKDFTRDIGFHVQDFESGFYDLRSRKQNKMSLSERDEFFAQIKNKLSETVQRIQAGEMAPNPMDFKICDTCHWSQICRAPHLL